MIQQWLALFGAVFAVTVNVMAWRMSPHHLVMRNARPVFAIKASMAAMYVVSFIVLLTGVDQAEWSRTLLWVTPLAFVGPWSLSALTTLVYAAGKAAANGNGNDNDNSTASGE